MALYVGSQRVAPTLTVGGGDVSSKANISLDNLNATGEAHFADPSLSNLNATGEAHFADPSLSNLSVTGQEILDSKLNQGQITNCITEIPQDINLALSSGTLTLKAGSKIYVPNGSGTFNTVTIASDITTSNIGTSSVQRMVCLNSTGTGFSAVIPIDYCFSGSTAPTSFSGGYAIWYDTSNNLVKKTSDSGSTWESGLSLPICIVTCTSGVITSLDQVFNGFGYIGSTVFGLPNVKALAPNGRNTDGTLKNTEHTLSSVWTTTLANNSNFALNVFGATAQSNNYVESETEPANNYTLWYKPSENIMYRKSGSGVVSVNGGCFFAYVQTGSSNITRFVPKYDFRALDYNDRVDISGWSMPSNKYTDLTLGASGTSYIAPENGWVAFSKNINAANQFIGIGTYINNDSTQGNYMLTFASRGSATGLISTIAPVSKGQIFSPLYSAAGTTEIFRFVYANGSC